MGEGVAAEESPGALEGAAPGSVFLEGADEVFAASGEVAAPAAEEESEGALVSADEEDEDPGEGIIGLLPPFAYRHRLFPGGF